MDGLRPMAPNYVNVGMMNCRPPKRLPDQLQKFMDESGDDGVIFVIFVSIFSFGRGRAVSQTGNISGTQLKMFLLRQIVV